MTANNEIKVGQHWQEVDSRFANMPVREVIRISQEFEGRYSDSVFGFREIKFRSLGNGRESTARTHTRTGVYRFNGKRGGYKLVKDVE